MRFPLSLFNYSQVRLEDTTCAPTETKLLELVRSGVQLLRRHMGSETLRPRKSRTGSFKFRTRIPLESAYFLTGTLEFCLDKALMRLQV